MKTTRLRQSFLFHAIVDIGLCCLATCTAAADPASAVNLWCRPELDSGEVRLTADADSSVIVLDTGSAPATGSLMRGLIVPAGGDVTVSARMKLGQRMTSASLALNLVGVDDGMRTVCQMDRTGQWVTARKTIAVPPQTGMVFLHLNFQGQGQLWVDDLSIDGALNTQATGQLNTFSMPFGYAFGAYENHADVSEGIAHIEGKTNQGGAGCVANADLTPFANQCPVLSVKLGPKNKASRIRLALEDIDGGKRNFEFDLTKASVDDFTQILASDGWAVSPEAADEPDLSFDPSRVKGHLLIGDWSSEPVDVFIREIKFAEATPELLQLRRAKVDKVKQQLAREEEGRKRAAEARERMLADGAEHPDDGPIVQYVGTVAPDVLALTIQERTRTPGRQTPYQSQPGDEIRNEKDSHLRLAWRDGRPALATRRSVWRKPEGKDSLQRLGTLVENGMVLTLDSEIHGKAISMETLDEPRAYRIRPVSAAAGTSGWQPVAVYRKSKPLERAENGQSPIRHIIYLRLPNPLVEGETYAIEMHGINTRQPVVNYAHLPQQTRSEAVHVSHVGFRPDDPLKRAYLSVWLGSGGEFAYDVDRFQLLEADGGQSVYEGTIRLAIAADQTEMLRPAANHNRTHVYHLDFSDFTTPGVYRVYVPGVGVSYPFVIGNDVWLNAFRTSMHGLLSHRSGIALGPPVTDYRRPRPFHPADGMKIFRLDITMLDGESDAVEKALRRLLGPDLEASSLDVAPQAWGGYMDAGDWDRRSLHLRVSYLQLELYEMFPDFFRKIDLSLPAEETGNRLPDILDEALWNIDFYRRLQDTDGGVSGGVESTAHPTSGETSWQESLLVGVFAADPVTSYRYAAVAAKLAGVLQTLDAARAETYRTSAVRAWRWAEENSRKIIEQVRDRGGRVKGTAEETVAESRALAAVELLRLTHEETYQAAFLMSSSLRPGADPGEQLDATFAYASLPSGVGDEQWKRKALERLIEQGEQALRMGQQNAFNISCRIPQLPMMGFVGYYSTPETAIGPVLPRLHYLTGDAKYLQGALAATQYAVGANPMNATMTTGLGHDYPRAPLHVDSRTIGCTPPKGITIYGPHDPTKAPGWVKTWVLGSSLNPPVDQWPASEFHIDVSAWPEMSEYTVHQTIGPTGYYWGYLAARRN